MTLLLLRPTGPGGSPGCPLAGPPVLEHFRRASTLEPEQDQVASLEHF